MAKQAAKNVDISINSVALEDDIDDFSLDIEQELPVVTSLADAGPRRLAGNFDFGLDIAGSADVAASQSDATLFALVGSAGVALDLETTGAAAGSNDPNYEATSMVLASYKLSGKVGGPLTFSASLKGNSALSRAVA